MNITDKVNALNHIRQAARLLKCNDLHQRAEQLAQQVTALDIHYVNEDYDAFITTWKKEYLGAEGEASEQHALLRDLITQYSNAEILPELQEWLQEYHCI